MIQRSKCVNPIGIFVRGNFVVDLRSTHPFLNAVAMANQALGFILFHGAKCIGNLAPENKRGRRHGDNCDAQCLFNGGSLHVTFTEGA